MKKIREIIIQESWLWNSIDEAHSEEKWKIYSHRKYISSNQLFSDFFSKKTLLSRNFWEKSVGVNFWNYHTMNLQSLYYETVQTVLFWDILRQKTFVCMNCEIYLVLEYANKPSWPTGFEKSEIHQPNHEKLQFYQIKIEAFLLNFQDFSQNQAKMPQSCFL